MLAANECCDLNMTSTGCNSLHKDHGSISEKQVFETAAAAATATIGEAASGKPSTYTNKDGIILPNDWRITSSYSICPRHVQPLRLRDTEHKLIKNANETHTYVDSGRPPDHHLALGDQAWMHSTSA